MGSWHEATFMIHVGAQRRTRSHVCRRAARRSRRRAALPLGVPQLAQPSKEDRGGGVLLKRAGGVARGAEAQQAGLGDDDERAHAQPPHHGVELVRLVAKETSAPIA